MKKNLPPRPNLDHLRRQAKELLDRLRAGDPEAVSTIITHLPAATGMSPAQAASASFRLADAQSAVARMCGFAGWPHLTHHVDQLRAMEGTWSMASLDVDGSPIRAGALRSFHIHIDGDRFRSGDGHEGVLNIDVETDPHAIDLEFVQGPEAGNTNRGIFRLTAADTLEFCFDLNGKARPAAFATSPGSGHAYQTFRRVSDARPENVTGGVAPVHPDLPQPQPCVGFDYVPSPTLDKLQGEWVPTRLVRDGEEAPATMLSAGLRTAVNNEVTVRFAGQVVIHALVRIDESHDPIHMDYYSLAEPTKGTIRLGIFRWVDEDEACLCMATTGGPRPTDFTATPGSRRTLGQWRRKT